MSLRIVSLVPSLTHAVATVGLKDAIVGCTPFCIAPPGLHKTATMVGGTKNPELETIASLNPTHVIVNDEENKPEHISWLKERFPTLETFPKSPGDVPDMLTKMGQFLGDTYLFESWSQNIRVEWNALIARPKRQRSYIYLIWREPYMVTGSDTYISSFLLALGLVNACPVAERYPTLTVGAMVTADPDMLFFSSEPYPFRYRDMARLSGEWPAKVDVPECIKIDGQLCSWYGTMTWEALRAGQTWLDGNESKLFL